MSQENVEKVRWLFEHAWNGRDFDAARGLFHPELVVDLSDSLGPDARVIRGHEEAERFWIEWMDAWESARWDIDEYLDAGDQVVVLGHFYGRGTGSGASVEAAVSQVYALRAGQIVHHRLFQRTSDALEAAGLRK